METGLFVVVITALLILSLYLKSPSVKGRLGEKAVRARLQKSLGSDNHILLNDLTLPVSGGTTQIDHIVMSPSGVFVIETKNMSGWIFGDAEQAKWKQAFRKRRFSFQNPLRQNYKHVKTIQEALGLQADQVHNVVVFVGNAVPKTKMPENVLWGTRALKSYLNRPRDVVFEPAEVERMARALKDQALEAGRDTNRSHVANLRAKAADRRDPRRCPKCGSELVQRNNRKTGEAFWGCSTFPKCRGIRKA